MVLGMAMTEGGEKKNGFIVFAHLGSGGVGSETISLSPSEATPASSTPAASSHLSPASVLPLILSITGKQRHFSHTITSH